MRRMWHGPSPGWQFLPFVRSSNTAARHESEYCTARFIKPPLAPASRRRSRPGGSNEPTRFRVSALRLSSSSSWEARMEVDNGPHRKRQHHYYLPTVRREIQASLGRLENRLTVQRQENPEHGCEKGPAGAQERTKDHPGWKLLHLEPRKESQADDTTGG